MYQLPKWVLANPFPAIHDFESLTVIEQTARIYGAMQSLIEEYNKFAETVNDELSSFTADEEEAREEFELQITKVMNEFMCSMEQYLKLNLDNTAKNVIIEGMNNGTIPVPTDSSLTIKNYPADSKATGDALAIERTRINNLVANPGSATENNAELIDLRVDFKGTTHKTAGESFRTITRENSGRIDVLESASVFFTDKDFVFETIKTGTGISEASENRLRLVRTLEIANIKRMSIEPGYRFKYFVYDIAGKYIGTPQDWTFDGVIKTGEDIASEFPTAHYLRVIISSNSNSATITKELVAESGFEIVLAIGKMQIDTDRIQKNSKEYGVKFIAHQGAIYHAPPNTMIGFARAFYDGCDGIESDVYFTADGVPVLCHDDAINAHAKNADGSDILTDVLITASTYNELLQYDFGISYGYAGTKIGNFYEYIDFCKVHGVIPYIELKQLMTGNQLQILLAYVEKRNIPDAVWSSAHSQNIINIAAMRKGIAVAYQQTDQRSATDYSSGDYRWFYNLMNDHRCIVRVRKDYADINYIDSLRSLGFEITLGTMTPTKEDVAKSKALLPGCEYHLADEVSKEMVFY